MATTDPTAAMVRVISAAFCTVPLAIVSLALARMFSSLMTAMSHNPIILDKGFTVILIAASLTEAIGLLILLVASIILFVS